MTIFWHTTPIFQKYLPFMEFKFVPPQLIKVLSSTVMWPSHMLGSRSSTETLWGQRANTESPLGGHQPDLTSTSLFNTFIIPYVSGHQHLFVSRRCSHLELKGRNSPDSKKPFNSFTGTQLICIFTHFSVIPTATAYSLTCKQVKAEMTAKSMSSPYLYGFARVIDPIPKE